MYSMCKMRFGQRYLVQKNIIPQGVFHLERLQGSFSNLRFMHRHADSDLSNMLASSAPPPDLLKIDCFQSHVEHYNKKAAKDT